MSSDHPKAEIVRNDTSPPSWTVEAVNTDGEGGVDVTIFSGPDAEKRAAEYAAWKYGTWRPARAA
jgi:hypothetical protein